MLGTDARLVVTDERMRFTSRCMLRRSHRMAGTDECICASERRFCVAASRFRGGGKFISAFSERFECIGTPMFCIHSRMRGTP